MNRMPTPPNDDTRTMFKLLADGQWHKYEEVRDGIAATVPPGRALRKYEDRLNSSRRIYTPTDPRELTEDEKITFGARACAQVTISSWTGRGVLRKIENDQKWVRLKPGFQTWGVDAPKPGPPKADETAVGATQESPQEGQGPTGVPPGDSVASEPRPAAPERPSVPEPVGVDVVRQEGGGDRPAASVVSRDSLGRVQQPREAAGAAPGSLEGPVEPRAAPKLAVVGPVQEVGRRKWEQEVALARAAVFNDEPDRPTDLEDADLVPTYADPPPTRSVTTTVCDVCGLEVASEVAHKEWHDRQGPPKPADSAMQFDDVLLRTLISDEIGRNLDSFQTGMQQWMNEMFGQLEAQIKAVQASVWAQNRWAQRDRGKGSQ